MKPYNKRRTAISILDAGMARDSLLISNEATGDSLVSQLEVA